MFVKILNGFNLLLSTVSYIMCLLITFYFNTSLRIKLFCGAVLVLSILLVVGNIIYFIEVKDNE